MKWRIDLNDIRLLMQVVEHGSYTAAARAVGVPKSQHPPDVHASSGASSVSFTKQIWRQMHSESALFSRLQNEAGNAVREKKRADED